MVRPVASLKIRFLQICFWKFCIHFISISFYSSISLSLSLSLLFGSLAVVGRAGCKAAAPRCYTGKYVWIEIAFPRVFINWTDSQLVISLLCSFSFYLLSCFIFCLFFVVVVVPFSEVLLLLLFALFDENPFLIALLKSSVNSQEWDGLI